MAATISSELRADIIRMARYITDDSTIAAYCKVSQGQVADLRKQIWRNNRTGDNNRSGPSIARNDDSNPFGLEQERRNREMCRDGSERLLAALWRHHPRIMTILGAEK